MKRQVDDEDNSARAKIEARTQDAKRGVFSFSGATNFLDPIQSARLASFRDAIGESNMEMVGWMLASSERSSDGSKSIFATDYLERTKLHLAAENGQYEAFLAIVQGLKVENGERAAMLNAVNFRGQTALHSAVENKSIPIIKWILSDSGGRASGFNNVLAKDGFAQMALHRAVFGSHETFLAVVEGLKVENGERAAMLNAIDRSEMTVLHEAARFGREDTAEWLLSEKGREAGFNREYLFALTSNKESALHFAAREGSVGIFDLLLSCCNNTSERLRLFLGRDDKGWTIFFHPAAVQCGGEIIAHILRAYPEESQVVIDARDNCGMTVLQRIIVEQIDDESSKEWRSLQRGANVRGVVIALLGFEEDDFPDDDDFEEEEEDDEKEQTKTKKMPTAAGVDLNLGLKFE